MKTKTQKKKAGISLIVLVITIAVMIILAAAIILSLNSSGIIGKANEAKAKTDKASMLQAANVAYGEYLLAKQSGETAQTGEVYVKAKLEGQFTEETLESLSILDDGTVQVLPTIPTGFVVSEIEGENKVSEGLVIYKLKENETEISAADWAATDTTTVSGQTLLKVQTERDQYVWIPVEGAFERKAWLGEDLTTTYGENLTVTYAEPLRAGIEYMDDITKYSGEIAQYNAMKASVETNGGFYIARYEAGQDGEAAVSKKGATVWDNIAWDSTWSSSIGGFGVDTNEGAAKISKATYANAERHLIYGVEWDNALKFIEDSEHSVTNSSTWGNYTNYNSSVDSSKQVEGAGVWNEPLTAGYSEHWKAKNIYDMAGNVWELTYEAFLNKNGSSWRVVRGGYCCANNGSTKPASSRSSLNPSGCAKRFWFPLCSLYKVAA